MMMMMMKEKEFTNNILMLSFATTANVKTAKTTLSGRSCQRWDSQWPHVHLYSNHSSFENYCVNPNGDAAAWCYTTDEHLRAEFCPLPILNGKTSY